ncbi:MAG: lipid-A-disaccharide synthase [Bacteroidia bacterium]|nr:lipid-A-disaccharide synthase [Bacteroidia bacterium]MDW8159161.1 lipid-A-disaccharide synthase [Bacteroidia bacterium]
MKFYCVAGENSGDLHGSFLVKALLDQMPGIHIRGVGGERMQAAGMELFLKNDSLNLMGFVEVIKHLPHLLHTLEAVKRDIINFQPNAVILIDYPGFNLRLAKYLKRHGIKVYYYISPQVWAWKESRINILKECVDKLFVILPFEVDFFERHDILAEFYGHPLLDAIASYVPAPLPPEVNPENKSIIAVLPGSRAHVVQRMLPAFLSLIPYFRDYQFIIAGTHNIDTRFYQKYIASTPATLVVGKTYDLMKAADFALVTSGTATLETGLFQVPMLVGYKGNWLSMELAKRLVKVKSITLVNLVLDQPLVPEFIQNDLTPRKLVPVINQYLRSPTFAQQTKLALAKLPGLLGGVGVSERLAKRIIALNI